MLDAVPITLIISHFTGQTYGVKYVKSTDGRLPILSFVLHALFDNHPTCHQEESDGQESTRVEFEHPCDEDLGQFEVRSNAFHAIHSKPVFGQWRVRLNHVRPVRTFQIPILLP